MNNLQKYIHHVEGVTGYRRSLARINQLTGNADTLLGSRAIADHVRGGQPSTIEWGVPTAAGAVAGGIIGAKYGHPILGAFSGGSLFTNTPALLKPSTRPEALWNMAQTHGGVLGSVVMKDNKAFGFALGWLAVGIARYLQGGGK